MTRMLLLRLFPVALAALIALPAGALVMEALPLHELTRRADVVVHGEVIGQTAQREAPGKDIWTTTSIRVIESLKGDAGTDVLAFKQLGGTVDGVTELIPGDAVFHPGEEVVVFLSKTPRGLVLYGFSQGKFTVQFDPVANAPLVSRDLSHAGLVTRNGRPLPIYAPARLDDFRAEIRADAASR